MKCYQAERGCYENQYIAGYYDSPERAMAAMPGTHWKRTTWAGNEDVPEQYRHLHHERYTTWANDLDWDDAVTITEVDLVIVSTGPERSADEAVRQVYRESDGGWDYLPEAIGHEIGHSDP